MTALKTTPQATIQQIQTLLTEGYCSGFTIFKELIQNADDVRATRLLMAGHDGFRDADNILLREPGIFVANNGPVSAANWEALQLAAGGGKGGDSQAVGRFGLGQKALYHLCDAYPVFARLDGDAKPTTMILNPYEDIEAADHARAWKTLSPHDDDLLAGWADRAEMSGGLVLRIPLRTQTLRPSSDTRICLSHAHWTPREALKDILEGAQLHATVACLRHIEQIDIECPGESTWRAAFKSGFTRLAGPGDTAQAAMKAAFGGRFTINGQEADVHGAQRCAAEGQAVALRSDKDWPSAWTLTGLEKAKATPHGAAVVCRHPARRERNARLRVWQGVYLPLGDPAKDRVILSEADLHESQDIDVVVHGDFFVSSNRTSILREDGNKGQDAIKILWNKALQREATLPCILDAVASAVQAMPDDKHRYDFVRALGESAWWRDNAGAICGGRALVRLLDPKSDRWSIERANALRPIPISDATRPRRLAEAWKGFGDWCKVKGVVLAQGAVLGESRAVWRDNELAELVTGMMPAALAFKDAAQTLTVILDYCEQRQGLLGPLTLSALAEGFRQAMANKTKMAPMAQIKLLSRHLSSDHLLVLPKAVIDPDILVHLAKETRTLCIRAEWVSDKWLGQDGTVPAPTLSPAQAIELLTALRPMVALRGRIFEQTLALIAQILQSGPSLADLARDVSVSTNDIIPVVRVSDEVTVLLSPVKILNLMRDRLVFDRGPIHNIAKLAAAVRAPEIFQLRANVAVTAPKGYELASPNRPMDKIAVLEKASQFGPIQSRTSLFSELRQHLSARSLRRLIAGEADLRDSDRLTRIVGLPDVLMPLVNKLTGNDSSIHMLDPAIAKQLSHEEAGKAQIVELDLAWLGDQLVRRSEFVEPLDDYQAMALLASDLPTEVLAPLALHKIRDEDRLHRPDALLRGRIDDVPISMRALVRTVDPWPDPKASRRQAELIADWTPEREIVVALASPEPHLLAAEIQDALGRIPNLDASLALDLRTRPWLVVDGRLVSPDAVCDLLPCAVPAWSAVLPGSPPVLRSTLPDNALAALDRHRLIDDPTTSYRRILTMMAGKGATGLLVHPMEGYADLVRLARARCDLGEAAWPMLASALRAFESEETLGAMLAGIEFTSPDTDAAIDQLNLLAGLVAREGEISQAARRLWRAGFEPRAADFREATGFLPADLIVESETGDFARAEELALPSAGVELRDSLAARWHFEVPDNYAPPAAGSRVPSVPIAEKVQELFAPFRSFHELHSAVLMVLALLGRGAAIRSVANQFNGNPGFDDICAELDKASQRLMGLCDPLPAHMAKLRMEVVPVNNNQALVLSAAGTAMLARAQREGALLYGCIKANDAPSSWQLSMSAVEPRDLDHATCLLRDTVLKLVAPIGMRLQNQTNAVLAQFDSYLASDQATLDELVKDIKDGLAERIKKLTRGNFLKVALTRYDADRKQGRHESDDAAARLRAKDTLWAEICRPEAAGELLNAIREKMHNRNYAPQRTLFELFQNAVDAAHQKGEQSDVRVEAMRDETGAIRRLRLIHWGRPINVPGGPNTPTRFERDLDNMLDLDSSEKEGQDRGKHGLGFKTCHMLSDDTRVASGRLLFRIHGGMIPIGWNEGRALQQAYNTRDAQATIIELPIRPGSEDDAGRAWEEFTKVAAFLPVVARSIGEIVIADGVESRSGKAYIHAITRSISLVEYGQDQNALRLDLGMNHWLYFKLLDGAPVPFANSWSRLWNLAPLDGENLDVAWLIDGQFEMDQGRRGLHGQAEDKVRVIARLGAPLGKRLVELFTDWAIIAPACGLTIDGRDAFMARLFGLMVGDMQDHLAKQLHGRSGAGARLGESRGLGTLVENCAVVALAKGGLVRADEVEGVYRYTLTDPLVRQKTEGWASRLGNRANVIDERWASRLDSLDFDAPQAIDLGTLAEDLCWNAVIGAQQAAELGTVFNSRQRETWYPEERKRADAALHTVQLRSQKGEFAQSNRLWFPQDAREGQEGKTERSRAGFMPPEARLHSDYRGDAVEFAHLARARAGYLAHLEREHLKTAYREPGRCLAALVYLSENPEHIDGLNWLPDVAALHALEACERLTPQQRGILEFWLGADLKPNYENAHDDDETRRSAEDILLEVGAWWRENRCELTARHDMMAYGELGELCSSQKLQKGDDAAWFTMLSLGSFQTLGRITPQQSRVFVLRGVNEGWWHDLASVGGSDRELRPYVERLLAWSDIGATEDYLTWRRCLGDMCLIARNLDAYRAILTALPQMIEQNDTQLALSQLLRPSSSHVIARMGIDAAPLAKSLGMGANWIVRELSRREFYNPDEAELVQPYAWSARLRIRNFLRRIGLGDFQSGVDHGLLIHRAIVDEVGEVLPFGGDGDLPLELLNTREPGRGLLPAYAQILNGTWSVDDFEEAANYA